MPRYAVRVLAILALQTAMVALPVYAAPPPPTAHVTVDAARACTKPCVNPLPSTRFKPSRHPTYAFFYYQDSAKHGQQVTLTIKPVRSPHSRTTWVYEGVLPHACGSPSPLRSALLEISYSDGSLELVPVVVAHVPPCPA